MFRRESRKMSVNFLPLSGFDRPVFRSGFAVALIAAAFLSGCGQAPVAQGITDPNEANNRQIHEFNRGVDKTILRPLSSSYDSILPRPVTQGVSNFAGNLDIPGDVLNNILQGRPGKALKNSFRFVVNSTIGLAGLFDPATEIGVAADPTDFGETLHVWGVGEGNYTEAPLLGPTTERDLVGTVVDLAMNPVRIILPRPESTYATGAKLASRLGDRARYSDTIDSVLYESADSYAQARLLYLQNRRFELGQTASDTGFEDPYEDPYAQ
jgi:phospholipid-binding lipoprotein MlaA